MLTIALLWLALPPASLGSPTVPSGAVQVEAQARQTDYRLGPADVLAVSVVGLKEFSTETEPWMTVVVSNSGRVHVPYVGVLNVRSMTAVQLESEIARRLREQDLVKEPQVTVRVKDYRGHTIYVLGEVAQPGQYYMREEMYLFDLLGLTMGFPTEGTCYLYRRGAAREKEESADTDTQATVGATSVAQAIPIDLHELAEGRRPDLNFKLQGGDILYVPFNRPKYFYATGEVNSPGAVELPPGRQILVSQAIAYAGGPTKTAKISKGILVRYDENGERRELALDFGAILNGRQPDYPVLENDIIFIPGSNAKSLGQGMLSVLPNFLAAGVW